MTHTVKLRGNLNQNVEMKDFVQMTAAAGLFDNKI